MSFVSIDIFIERPWDDLTHFSIQLLWSGWAYDANGHPMAASIRHWDNTLPRLHPRLQLSAEERPLLRHFRYSPAGGWRHHHVLDLPELGRTAWREQGEVGRMCFPLGHHFRVSRRLHRRPKIRNSAYCPWRANVPFVFQDYYGNPETTSRTKVAYYVFTHQVIF